MRKTKGCQWWCIGGHKYLENGSNIKSQASMVMFSLFHCKIHAKQRFPSVIHAKMSTLKKEFRGKGNLIIDFCTQKERKYLFLRTPATKNAGLKCELK